MTTEYLPEIANEPGDQVEFVASNTYILEEYVAGDFDGNSTSHCLFFSDTPGSPSTLDLSLVGDITVQYCDFQDITVINGTITDVGGIDNGNNIGIKFFPVIPPVYWGDREADVTKPEFRQAEPNSGIIVDIFINPRDDEHIRHSQQYQK